MGTTDEQKATEEEKQGADKGDNKLPEKQPGDWLLRHLVRMINELDSGSMGITLCVQGTIVSGDMISGATYLKTFGKEMDESLAANSGKGGDGIKESFAKMAERLYGKEAPKSTVEFIHLADARVFSPGGHPLPNNRGVLFRARITEVGAFTVGKLAAASEE